ncbi:glycosyltransferase family 4 protein [Vibrio algarum]|uniref:Glycosyltransferase family 4 protein n=1 Tax=Vibrio algarum TaxID=3020714 RepID=A0ABT4YQS3_9VIBR|nr:glycosyltransferase family 4 protein [Vibrio sp. KJ40-1]MDB1123720.1 glycosyltransferase family 4 protein [Vibrio sp. KJ40-1]
MKILYHHRIASKDGQYVHIEEIINALTNLGHEVIIVAPQVAEKSEFGSDGGWVSKVRASLPKFISEVLEFGYSFYVFFKLCQAIIKHRPDGIYERYNLYLPAGIWAKKLFKLNLILEVNSPLYDERNKYGGISLTRLAKWTEHYTWRNADHVLPVTKVMASYVERVGVSPERISVVHNGIDPLRFHLSESKDRDLRFKNKLVIGFVGFCREWHKLDEVITLIANENNPNLMLLIIGDGPVLEELKTQAKSLGLENNFHITGLVERKNIPHWLDQIDIAIQPAVTPWCSPLKLIEYLGTGKAIVAPDTANIRELLKHNHNALLFDSESPENMLEQIKLIISDDVLLKNLQSGAYQTINELSLTWEQNAELICRLLGQKYTEV